MIKKLIIARHTGFCFGVARALELARAAEPPLWCIGPPVHNEAAVEQLRAEGIHIAESLDDVPEGAGVMLRSHGADKALCEALRGRRVVDATCPCVARIHNIVQTKSGEGRRIMIFGSAEHPEVRAVASRCADAAVISSLEELAARGEDDRRKPYCVVSQTTAHRGKWEECVYFLKKHYTNVEIIDTICGTADTRRREAEEMAAKADILVVVGDNASSNTRNLAACAPNAVIVPSSRRLPALLRERCVTVAVTAGTSTPASIIEEVVKKMEEMMNAEVGTAEEQAPQEADTPETRADEAAADNGESFAELLESSVKTLYTGDKVTGVITAISPTEVSVDLGTKHAGYIPVDELSEDPSESVQEKLKVGDEIEVFVVRVNDVEGTTMLSRKRLEVVKSWETVEAARESGAVLEGTVTEENKGGVVVSVKGVRVFVPASQSGLPKDAQLSQLVSQKVRLRITEFNRARRRVVGSVRAVQQEERKAASDAVWESLEVGKTFEGTVKSLTSYGAFVDIGGIDGMVHVSELSWQRIAQPSDVVKPGDRLTVRVLGFDREKKKISLAYRKPEDNPWTKFLNACRVNDVLDVKVVKLMPFGAFCEILPGVDGLVHISHLAHHHVAKPSDVVNEGDVIKVKLIAVDCEKKKISLSVKALTEPEEDEGDGGASDTEAVAIPLTPEDAGGESPDGDAMPDGEAADAEKGEA
ncbi:MAG: bifunctional 4-hydroxy-3-methylbut-2-enyl diphosphate reductase/30S ribosomal protein S1 [Oscillospiraceae bacterium]|jgi:4-hydroxy-3-methylbut-2-enyl diphosphate reductase|nr:bifunctional 4-hydroxy-3-methylbut-2-enyl diphosphate reductase/30S ribosomal protein S1 [Oscillospiraceae bacterium]